MPWNGAQRADSRRTCVRPCNVAGAQQGRDAPAGVGRTVVDGGAGCVDGGGSGIGAGMSSMQVSVQIRTVRCGIFFIRILMFQREFATFDAKRLHGTFRR
jgi:hypothetical protein